MVWLDCDVLDWADFVFGVCFDCFDFGVPVDVDFLGVKSEVDDLLEELRAGDLDLGFRIVNWMPSTVPTLDTVVKYTVLDLMMIFEGAMITVSVVPLVVTVSVRVREPRGIVDPARTMEEVFGFIILYDTPSIIPLLDSVARETMLESTTISEGSIKIVLVVLLFVIMPVRVREPPRGMVVPASTMADGLNDEVDVLLAGEAEDELLALPVAEYTIST